MIAFYAPRDKVKAGQTNHQLRAYFAQDGDLLGTQYHFHVLFKPVSVYGGKMDISPIRQKQAVDMQLCPISSDMHSNMWHSLCNEVPSVQSGKVSSSVQGDLFPLSRGRTARTCPSLFYLQKYSVILGSGNGFWEGCTGALF